MPSSIFTKIINREIQSEIISENKECIAFLDSNPLTIGHTLVIPKKEKDYIFDLGDLDYANLMLFAKDIAIILKQAIPCKRIGMGITGFGVAHAHVHLVPINSTSDMGDLNKTIIISALELKEIADHIRKYVIL